MVCIKDSGSVGGESIVNSRKISQFRGNAGIWTAGSHQNKDTCINSFPENVPGIFCEFFFCIQKSSIQIKTDHFYLLHI